MPRTIPKDRFEELVRVATGIFIAQGYRRTQMGDVADAMGVAKGTIYLYVESKEALFDLVVRNADRTGLLDVPKDLPLGTPAAGSTVSYVAKTLAERQTMPRLLEALERTRVTNVRGELEGVLRELYTILTSNRTGLKLLDRCSQDHPELGALWREGGRQFLLELLVSYFQKRKRYLRPSEDLAITARIVIEHLVLWAVHRHWDPMPQPMNERVAEDTLVSFVLHGLLSEVPS